VVGVAPLDPELVRNPASAALLDRLSPRRHRVSEHVRVTFCTVSMRLSMSAVYRRLSIRRDQESWIVSRTAAAQD
jgi:hypothetical protein